MWGINPDHQDEDMTSFVFGSTALIVNPANEDARSTIAFTSKNCDQDYKAVIARGAISVSEPGNKPWGVRIAFVQGPGKLTFEIEEKLQKM